MNIKKIYNTYKRLDEKITKGDFSKEFGKQLIKDLWETIKEAVKIK